MSINQIPRELFQDSDLITSVKQQETGFDIEQARKDSKDKDQEDGDAMPNENIVTEDICKSEVNGIQSPAKTDKMEVQQDEPAEQ